MFLVVGLDRPSQCIPLGPVIMHADRFMPLLGVNAAGRVEGREGREVMSDGQAGHHPRWTSRCRPAGVALNGGYVCERVSVMWGPGGACPWVLPSSICGSVLGVRCGAVCASAFVGACGRVQCSMSGFCVIVYVQLPVCFMPGVSVRCPDACRGLGPSHERSPREQEGPVWKEGGGSAHYSLEALQGPHGVRSPQGRRGFVHMWREHGSVRAQITRAWPEG